MHNRYGANQKVSVGLCLQSHSSTVQQLPAQACWDMPPYRQQKELGGLQGAGAACGPAHSLVLVCGRREPPVADGSSPGPGLGVEGLVGRVDAPAPPSRVRAGRLLRQGAGVDGLRWLRVHVGIPGSGQDGCCVEARALPAVCHTLGDRPHGPEVSICESTETAAAETGRVLCEGASNSLLGEPPKQTAPAAPGPASTGQPAAACQCHPSERGRT